MKSTVDLRNQPNPYLLQFSFAQENLAKFLEEEHLQKQASRRKRALGNRSAPLSNSQ